VDQAASRGGGGLRAGRAAERPAAAAAGVDIEPDDDAGNRLALMQRPDAQRRGTLTVLKRGLPRMLRLVSS